MAAILFYPYPPVAAAQPLNNRISICAAFWSLALLLAPQYDGPAQ
jgi:hypothetical protein